MYVSTSAEQFACIFDSQQKIEKATRCLKAMAHPARLRILHLLMAGECNVQNLEQHTGLAQASLSQHLSVLKDRGIVASRRDGGFSYYSLTEKPVAELFDVVQKICCE
jgi:ArsR family transcriptional regulator